jgi:hypothetical protein
MVCRVRASGIVMYTIFAHFFHKVKPDWNIVYTFWYHPAEHTMGHLLGFFYSTMMLARGSLFFTRLHVNKW